jgi:hypothetical protein
MSERKAGKALRGRTRFVSRRGLIQGGWGLMENVGSQFVSLRHPIWFQHSPPACGPLNGQLIQAFARDLRTALRRWGVQILSLWPFFSKAPDCAYLVRNS